MRFAAFCLAVVTAVVLVSPAQAVITVDVGNHVLFENMPGQTIDIFASGPDAVGGMQVFAMTGDGGPDAGGIILAPTITDLDIITATIFAANFTAPGDPIGPGYPQVEARSTTTGSGTVAVDGNNLGKIATITVDTTGFFFGQGPFALVLSATPGGNTEFYMASSAGIETDFTDGEISLIQIPEPSSLALSAFGIVALIGFGIRRRRVA